MKLLTNKQRKIKNMEKKCDDFTRKITNCLIVLLVLLIILNVMVVI